MTTALKMSSPATDQTFSLIMPLAAEEALLEAVGGKGASLARLARAGLPVPDGFHITTVAYAQLVAANDLQPAVLAALSEVDATLPATLETASQTIGALFAAATIPPQLGDAIARAYAALPGAAPSVAVRSSATAEDLPELSFAGQQESFLNVSGVEALLAAVKACWSSLWTARAIGYRATHGIDPDALSLAVTVQLMAPAEAAGILFTANPINGRRDQAMITAAWGLGEAIVGGTVTPDTLVVDKVANVIVERTTARKQVMTVRIAGGTEEQAVPDALQEAPALDDATALALVGLGQRIEELYNLPVDVEWTHGAGALAIVQARPITALPEPAVAPPDTWPLPDPKGKYMRASVVELLPDPLTPLFATLGLAAINAQSRRLMMEFTGGTDLWSEPCVTINQYAYLNGGFGPGNLIRILFGVMRRVPWMLRTAESRWRDQAHGDYMAVVARRQAPAPTEQTVGQLLAGVREIAEAGVRIYTALQSGIMPAANMSEGLFTFVYNRLIRRPDDPPAVIYLLGFDSTPIRSDKALYDLAIWLRSVPVLADYVTSVPAATLATHLRADTPPQDVPGTVWQEWRTRFETYLACYGQTIYNLDFAMALPIDEPAPVLETLKIYVGGTTVSPYTRQEKAVAERTEACAAMNQRLHGVRGYLFRKLLPWAQRFVPLREDALADIGYGWPLLRQMLLEIGRRFAAAGVIEEAEQIFWLEENEVETVGSTLEAGDSAESLTASIRIRQAEWKAAKQVTPPPALPVHTRWMGVRADKVLPARVTVGEARQLSGVAGSPGRVTATARVLHGPEDFAAMQPGDVLVAAITTPAWTPLFALAAAVVTDVGGPLSHSSIVAREYGVPAVLGTGSATQRIHSGQTITVDGTEGVVILPA